MEPLPAPRKCWLTRRPRIWESLQWPWSSKDWAAFTEHLLCAEDVMLSAPPLSALCVRDTRLAEVRYAPRALRQVLAGCPAKTLGVCRK